MSKKIVQTALIGAFIGFSGISEGNAGSYEDFLDFKNKLCSSDINNKCSGLWLNLNIKAYQAYTTAQFKELCDGISTFCKTVPAEK